MSLKKRKNKLFVNIQKRKRKNKLTRALCCASARALSSFGKRLALWKLAAVDDLDVDGFDGTSREIDKSDKPVAACFICIILTFSLANQKMKIDTERESRTSQPKAFLAFKRERSPRNFKQQKGNKNKNKK